MIREIVERTPDLGADTEILFVEGGSSDGTREEVEKQIAAHPDREISRATSIRLKEDSRKLLGQLLRPYQKLIWLLIVAISLFLTEPAHGATMVTNTTLQATDDEVVVFSWIVYKDKASRDEIMAKVMEHPRMEDWMANPPFDGNLLQVMPWPAYRDWTDRDLLAIYEYLRSIPCIASPGHSC